MWRVVVPNRVRRRFTRSVPPDAQDRVLAALDELSRDGPHARDVRALFGSQYRKRVGEYRIIFEAHFSDRSIRVKNIARRTTTTYRRRP